MMRFAILTLLISTSVLIAGCGRTVTGNACDGWSALRPGSETAKYIAKHDRGFAEGVLAHNEHGENIRCWSAGK